MKNENQSRGGRRSPTRTSKPKPGEPKHTAESRPVKAAPEPPTDAPQKLHKMLALAGLGSRRDMETVVQSGRVTVNGQIAEQGMRVGPQDIVKLDKRIVKLKFDNELPRVLLYHKPEGAVMIRKAAPTSSRNCRAYRVPNGLRSAGSITTPVAY